MQNPPHSFRVENERIFLIWLRMIVLCWWNSLLMQNKHGDDHKRNGDRERKRDASAQAYPRNYRLPFGNCSSNCVLSAIEDLFYLFVYHLLYTLIVELLYFGPMAINLHFQSHYACMDIFSWCGGVGRLDKFRRFKASDEMKNRNNNNR